MPHSPREDGSVFHGLIHGRQQITWGGGGRVVPRWSGLSAAYRALLATDAPWDIWGSNSGSAPSWLPVSGTSHLAIVGLSFPISNVGE